MVLLTSPDKRTFKKEVLITNRKIISHGPGSLEPRKYGSSLFQVTGKKLHVVHGEKEAYHLPQRRQSYLKDA